MEEENLINLKIILIIAAVLFFFTTDKLPIMTKIKDLFINNLLLSLILIIIAIYALTEIKWQK